MNHLHRNNPVHDISSSNSIGQVKDHYVYPHIEYGRKSETILKPSQHFMKYFLPSISSSIIRRSDSINEPDSKVDFNNKFESKSDYEDKIKSTSHSKAAQQNKEKVQNHTENPVFNKYIIRGKYDEPMIPIIHSYLTMHGIQPKVPNTTEHSVRNKYIIRSDTEEPMIPIIHMATQALSSSNLMDSQTRSSFLKHITPSSRPTLSSSNDLQQASPNNRHYKTNHENLVDFLAMLHIIPHADEVDFL